VRRLAVPMRASRFSGRDARGPGKELFGSWLRRFSAKGSHAGRFHESTRS
jgi:hypothetical protein